MNYIFSDQGIDELKSRLGIQPEYSEGEVYDDAEFTQVDGFTINETIETNPTPNLSAGGVSFPFPITISSPVSRIAPDGSTVFDIVISFDDVIGATDYEVRYVVQN